mmetsp:Transcript_60595/g.153980  ORF Transcript_60595/g.153980 Transcript_60595/m.153980 type:complete len:204 (-) Transcript_60595:140-751(-)
MPSATVSTTEGRLVRTGDASSGSDHVRLCASHCSARQAREPCGEAANGHIGSSKKTPCRTKTIIRTKLIAIKTTQVPNCATTAASPPTVNWIAPATPAENTPAKPMPMLHHSASCPCCAPERREASVEEELWKRPVTVKAMPKMAPKVTLKRNCVSPQESLMPSSGTTHSRVANGKAKRANFQAAAYSPKKSIAVWVDTETPL